MQKPYKAPIETMRMGGCAIVRFARPELKNPLSIETLELLDEKFSHLETDADIARIIFTGSGDTFAAGANLHEIAKLTSQNVREFALRGQNLMQKILRSKKETIAAIDGFCMGGALDLAVSCKARIASPRSVFAHPGVSLGIITGWGGTQMLPRLIGESRAMEMFLTGRRVDAQEALFLGLIHKIQNKPLETSVSKLPERAS